MYAEIVQANLCQIKGYAGTKLRQWQCFLQVERDQYRVITGLGQ